MRARRVGAEDFCSMRFAACVLSCVWAAAADAQPWRAQVGALAAYDAASVREAGDWLVQKPASGARLLRGAHGDEIVLTNGLIARTLRLAPNAATVGFDQLASNTSLIRGVKPEAVVEIDGTRYEVGGLKGQPNYAFLRPEWIDAMTADPAAFQFSGFESGPIEPRMAWAQVRHHAPDAVWPPKGVHLRMDYTAAALPGVTVSVHYELYDAVPVMSKWVSVRNGSAKAITINSFTCEVLAAVEYASDVDDRVLGFPPPNIHVESDFSFGGMSARDASREAVHWVEDPEYRSQVSWPRKNPCLLEVRPTLGPEQAIEPGAEFVSFRAFELPFDSYERERNSLAVRRMYRTIAPWVTENPLMLHVRYADWDTVKNAVDQCADVGFEMIILTFGSGANIEDRSAENIAKLKQYADYARSKGIEFGAYSLLASRSIDAANDVVMPAGETPAFGHSPCLQSEWGRNYFDTLHKFYEATGFALLEHDGSYPGDPCTSAVHPGHRGLEDSRWAQWKEIADFYRWCLGRGIYLNVPDFYFLAGATKCGMGYREENWSLPREQQVIHTRQNIFDGTWEKTPSMGWMFVPLTVYQGGGAAATIEPLKEHLDHYRAMVQSNLAFGVQACYRGPRLYDAPETRDMLKAQVDWYKAHRDILESDVVHGRRADGRDVDWALHVNPALEEQGMLVAFNPLNEAVTRTLRVNMYYTGLTGAALVSEGGAAAKRYAIDAQGIVTIEATVPAQGFAWWSLRAAK
jgi:hypothetical protein